MRQASWPIGMGVILLFSLTGCDMVKEKLGMSDSGSTPAPGSAPARLTPSTPPPTSASNAARATPARRPSVQPILRATPIPKSTPRGTYSIPRQAKGQSKGRVGAGTTKSSSKSAGKQMPKGPRKYPESVEFKTVMQLGPAEIPAGTYAVSLAMTEAGPMIELSSEGNKVVSEMALTPVKPIAGVASGSWLWHDTRQESQVRVYTQQDGKTYFIVLAEPKA